MERFIVADWKRGMDIKLIAEARNLNPKHVARICSKYRNRLDFNGYPPKIPRAYLQ